MTISSQVVRFQKSTGANGTTQDVALNFTPKALLLFSNGGTADATLEAHYQQIIGMSDGTTSVCIHIASEDAAAASDTGRILADGIFIRYNTAAPSVTLVCQGTCVFATNKVTFTWVTNDAVATDITLVAYGGADITAAFANGANIGRNTAGTQDYTGLGFTPTGNGNSVLFLLSTQQQVFNTPGTTATGMFGCATSTTTSKQWYTCTTSEVADPSDTWRVSGGDRCFGILGTTGAFSHFATLNAWITDGFRLNWDGPPTATDFNFSYLVINGGNWDSGTLTAPASALANQDYAVSVNSKPIKSLVLTGNAGVTTAAIVANALYSIAATDATTTSSIGAIDEDAQNTMDNYRYSDTTSIARLITANGALTDRATFDSFTTNNFRLDWVTKTVNLQLFHWLVAADQFTVFARTTSDSVVITDSILKKAKKITSSSLVITDSILKKAKKITSSSLVITDSILKKAKKITSDSVVVSDSLSRTQHDAHRTVVDNLTITDSILKKAKKITSDSLVITDSILKKAKKITSDSVVITDSLVKKLKFTVLDSLTITDSILKKVFKIISDTVDFVDTGITRVFTPGGAGAFQVTADDSLTISDSILKKAFKSISDSLSITDSLVKKLKFTVSDSLSITDSILKKAYKVISDSLTINDSIVKKAFKSTSDSLSITDSIIKKLKFTILDNLTIIDSLLRRIAIFRSTSSSLSITDSIALTQKRVTSSILTIGDSLTRRLSAVRSISDSLSITDVLGYKYRRTIVETAITITDTINQIRIFVGGAVRAGLINLSQRFNRRT